MGFSPTPNTCTPFNLPTISPTRLFMRPALRDVLYLTAPSGAGKSTFARAYADTFLDTFSRGSRKPTIVVVCKDDPKDDPAYNKLKYVHLRPEELVVGYETPDGTSLDKPIELETFVDP